MQNEIRDQRNCPVDPSESADIVEEELYLYNKRGDKFNPKYNANASSQPPKRTEQCKISQRSGRTAEKCNKRICENCNGKGHSHFECPSYNYRKISTTKGKKPDYMVTFLFRVVSLRG